jgi:enoyl-CoA hydratase/carnithine racemase
MSLAAFTQEGDLGEIVIDSPPLNLFGDALIGGLLDAVEEASATESRVLLLRAEGAVFSGGADVEVFAGLDHAGAASLMTRVLSLIGSIEAIQVPTVALIHGRCFAGALEVALACDVIWAAERTQIGQLEAVIGAYPFAGGVQRLASRIGAARTAEMVFGAHVHSAEDLAAWGCSGVCSRRSGLPQRGAPSPRTSRMARRSRTERRSEFSTHGAREASPRLTNSPDLKGRR